MRLKLIICSNNLISDIDSEASTVPDQTAAPGLKRKCTKNEMGTISSRKHLNTAEWNGYTYG